MQIGELVSSAVDNQAAVKSYNIDDVFAADKAARAFVFGQRYINFKAVSIIQPNFLASAASVFGTVWPYVVAVLLFLMMIIIHEFGHFIFAKMLGVRVNEFSVGFGPTLFKHQGKETLYSVRLIPFGGYCAMEGEDESSNDSRAFLQQSRLAQIFNCCGRRDFQYHFSALFWCLYIFAPAGAIATNTVASFSKDATSVNYGLKEGDEIFGG